MCKKEYSIYEHIFPNGKRYYGFTSRNLHDRFQKDGIGYKSQLLMWNAIQKYGWDNIQHNRIAVFDNEQDAKNFETKIIRKHKTSNPKFGYNIIECDNDRKNLTNIIYYDELLCTIPEYKQITSCEFIKNINRYKFEDDIEIQNINGLNVYHRFTTGDYAGLIYVDINIDTDTHLITENEYEEFIKDKHLSNCLRLKTGLKKYQLTYENLVDIDLHIMNAPTLLIYSLFDGKYYCVNKPSLKYKKEFDNLIMFLNDERIKHENIIKYFYITKKYLNRDDLYMIRTFGKVISKLVKGL